MRKLLDKTFWKFLLVGVINTLFGTAIMLAADGDDDLFLHGVPSPKL